MKATILGSAAGGGYPQWNCGCPRCVAVRAKVPGFEPRTQDSIALTAGSHGPGSRVVLLNASPEVLSQVQRTRALWPVAPRHSPIAAVVLTNGDLDHVLGLFSLRESWPLALYATETVWRGLASNDFVRTLARFDGQLSVRTLPLDREIALADARGEPLGMRVRAFALPGKAPVHLAAIAAPSEEDNVGLSVRAEGGSSTLAYATTCGDVDARVREALCGHDVLLFDGTFYREDELGSLGLGTATAQSMAHVPMSGERGSLVRLAELPGRVGPAQRIYSHVNNTNPVLGPSVEREEIEAAGWSVARDGLEIELP